MRRRMVTLAALMLYGSIGLHNQAFPQSVDTNSAKFVLPWCKGASRMASGESKIPHEMLRDLPGVYLKMGECLGVINTIHTLASTKDIPTICIPNGVNGGQALLVVIDWIEKHPAMIHLDFTLLAFEAFKDTWPCSH